MFLKEADLDKVLRIFKRYDVSTLVFARFVPTLRTLVSVPAGFVGMSLLRFTTFTTLGTFLWNAVLVGAGLLLGRNWRAVLPFINVYGWVVLAVLVGASCGCYGGAAALPNWFEPDFAVLDDRGLIFVSRTISPYSKVRPPLELALP